MKIAVDCRALRKPPSGIPNYIVSAVNTMSAQHPEWQIYLLSNSDFHPENSQRLMWRNNVNLIVEPLWFAKDIAFIWYLLKSYSILKRLKPDLFWAPNFLLPPLMPAGLRTLITIPDVVFKQYKHTMQGANRLFFEFLYDQSINKADMLWAISDYTRLELEKYFPKRKCRNIFVGLSINQEIFKRIPVTEEEKQRLLDKFGLTGKFILFVGTLEPRKNLPFLLSLMPELAKDGYNLLIVGAKGWGKTHIKELIETPGYPKGNVVFAGFVATDELVKLYNIASIYVSTSRNEGFGLPQMEAMACGCPVVSPHNSAMIEVVEGAGETVNTWNHQHWIDTINKVYADRNHYVEAGLKRVREQSWSAIINRLADYIAR